MKRFFLLCTALLLTLCLSACNLSELMDGLITYRDPDIVEDKSVYLTVQPEELTYSEGYTPVTSHYAYDVLPLQGEKALYDELVAVCYDISPEQSEDAADKYPMPQVELNGYSLSEAQVRTVIRAIYDDRPEIFWPSGTIGYYSDDESTVVQVYSSYSPEEVDERLSAMRKAASDFYATVPDGLTEYQRERTVHDFILERTAYDDDVDKENYENNDSDIYTAYGALVDGVAVCEGYARAFQLLLNGLGVDCVGITGTAGDELHMWNAVKLDDGWYGVDVTWDDHDEIYYRYLNFNLTDAQLAEDHTASPLFTEISDGEINGEVDGFNANVMNLFIPPCTDDTMTYFYQETAHLSGLDGADVKNALYSAAERQDDCFLFYVEERLDYENTVAVLFRDYPQYFFSYINSVNGYLDSYSIDDSNIGYYSFPERRCIAVSLNYY